MFKKLFKIADMADFIMKSISNLYQKNSEISERLNQVSAWEERLRRLEIEVYQSDFVLLSQRIDNLQNELKILNASFEYEKSMNAQLEGRTLALRNRINELENPC
jgi:uncharacterized coiled-coil DUF342 family protein